MQKNWISVICNKIHCLKCNTIQFSDIHVIFFSFKMKKSREILAALKWGSPESFGLCSEKSDTKLYTHTYFQFLCSSKHNKNICNKIHFLYRNICILKMGKSEEIFKVQTSALQKMTQNFIPFGIPMDWNPSYGQNSLSQLQNGEVQGNHIRNYKMGEVWKSAAYNSAV